MLRRRILSAYVVNSLFVILVSVAALFSGSEAALGQCTDSETQNRIRKVLDARSRLREQETYAALFDGCPLETVGSLKTHSNSGVAIRAAWEEVDRCLRGLRDSPSSVGQNSISAFRGFIIGRLQVRPPSWWEHKVASWHGISPSHAQAMGEHELYPTKTCGFACKEISS